MYIGEIVRLAREKTGNSDFTQDSDGNITEGISTDLVMAFVNDALAFVQSRIISVYPGAFVEENIQSVVSGQESYTVQDNVFLNNKFVSIEYSQNGALDCYYPLAQVSLLQRNTSPGQPYQYIRRNGQLLLNPIPNSSQGSLRVNFYRTHDRLDVRRGQITSEDDTSITLDNDSYLDSVALARAQYICIVSALGEVLYRNIPIVSYDNVTRVIDIASQTLTGITGAFVVCGKYRTTHLQDDMPERVEDYLRLVTEYKLEATDSSLDAINSKKDVADCLNDLVDGFSELSEDIQDIPIADKDLV